jgi:glycosyltransferase involved in cell wall biosynthesis
LSVFSKVDKVYYPSQVEVEVILETRPGTPVQAIPLYVLDDSEEGDYRWEDRQDILFVAGFNHPPNVDGLCWFIDEVMPLVWQSCPQLKVHVVGSNAPVVVTALATDRVIVHGYLSDEELARQYSRARMVAVPLRFGAGVKGKVLEALQHGLPLVTTPIGAEGLPEPESVFNVEDTAEDFAAALVALEQGDSKRLQRCQRYCHYLNEHFSKARAREILFRDFGTPDIEREAMA